MTTATDNASADILNRINSLFYSSAAQKDIAVVFIDDNYLNRNQLNWPLTYKQQSLLLRQILRYEPRGVFVDLLYTHDHSREGDSPRALLNVLQRYGERVPIYLPSVDAGLLTDTEFSPYTIPVAVQWSGYEHYYPARANGLPTPAFALYSQYCRQAGQNCLTDPVSPPISVQWGMQLAAMQNDYTDNRRCMSDANSGAMVIKILLSEIFWKLVPEWRQPCAYSVTLPPDYLSANNPDEQQYLQNAIKGKFVFLGALIQGARDEIYSPVHGNIAGVYLHAMALDNLLTYGAGYLRPAPNIIGNIDLADLTDCVLFLIVFMWREKVIQRQQDGAIEQSRNKRFIVKSALALLALLSTVVFVFSYLLNYQPINWVAQLTLILTIFAVKIRLFSPIRKMIKYLKGYTKEKFV